MQANQSCRCSNIHISIHPDGIKGLVLGVNGLVHQPDIDGLIEGNFGLCLHIGLLVAPLNTVKVGIRLLCCGMRFTFIHLFVKTRHNINTFPKGFVE